MCVSQDKLLEIRIPRSRCELRGEIDDLLHDHNVIRSLILEFKAHVHASV